MGKIKPNQNHKSQKKTPSLSKCIPLAPKSHVLCGRHCFQCVFCLMLVFQHPQLEERKISTRLGAFTNQSQEAGKRGARNSPQSGPPQKAARTKKVRGLLSLLNSWEHTNAREGKSEFITSQAAHSAATAPASLSPPSKKTKISKPRHLWEQPLASCPALCNQPVFTPTGRRRLHWLAFWSTRPFPRLQGDKLLLKKSAPENPWHQKAAPGGSCPVPSRGLP